MNGDEAAGRPAGRVAACPICGQPRAHDYRPFCSKRCADVDLGRWLNGVYAIAGGADAEEDGEPSKDRAGDRPSEA
jgi:hypothetical protein